jgi:hypothetical protein
MSAEQVFGIAGQLTMVCWILLAASLFIPRLRKGVQWLAIVAWPTLIGLTYLAAMAADYPAPQGGFGSLADVRLLFSSDWILLAGWVHYLVFDYFVGAWMVRDSDRQNVHAVLVLPCLFLCLMAGPLGLLLYLMFRGGRKLMPSKIPA